MVELSSFPMVRASPFDPPPEYSRLRAAAPVCKVKIWNGSEPWLITRYEDQRIVLGDRRFSANSELPGFPVQTQAYSNARKVLGRNFITMDSPEHDVYRRMLSKEFSIRRIGEKTDEIQANVDRLLDELLALDPPADLVGHFALPLPLQTICSMLGIPDTDHGAIRSWVEVIMTKSTEDQVRAAATEMLAYFGELIAARQRVRADDTVSGLVDLLERGEIDRQHLASTCVLLLTAGHETTANMISLGTLTLLQHPEQLAELRAAIDDVYVIDSAVEELLRFLTVTHAGRRRIALADVEVGGQLIKAGEGLILANDSANRDESILENPDQLDLRRGFRRHLAFGFGNHQCSGQHLARTELRIAFGSLLSRIPSLRLAVPLEEIRFRHDMTVYGVHELPVAW